MRVVATCLPSSRDERGGAIEKKENVMPLRSNSKRGKPTRMTTRRYFAFLKSILLADRREEEADYCRRGRQLGSLKDSALKQRWVDYLRWEFDMISARRTEGKDILAELSLRGIACVELPPDLIRLMTVKREPRSLAFNKALDKLSR